MQKYQSFTFLIAFYCYYLIVDGLIAVQESYVLMFPIWDNCRYKYCELCPLIHNDILYSSYSANLTTHLLIIIFNSFRLTKRYWEKSVCLIKRNYSNNFSFRKSMLLRHNRVQLKFYFMLKSSKIQEIAKSMNENRKILYIVLFRFWII